MKFGLFYLPTYLPQTRDAQTHYRNMVDQVVFADKIGIDYVWMVEHHFVRHGGLLPSNFTFLSYLAAKTERIRLGTGAVVLALNDPVRVAEQAAALDQLSQGRFDLGVGRGFLRDEFDAFGVAMKDSRERVEEGVDLIKKAWAGPALTYESKYRPKIDNLLMLPPVYQKPHPPIWNACFLTQESFEWTAREGYNLLYVAYHVEMPLAKERMGWYIDALKANGRKVADYEVCCVYPAHFVDAKDDAAVLEARVSQAMFEYTTAGVEAAKKPPDPTAYKGYTAREDYQRQMAFDNYFPNRVMMGNPERALDRIQQLRDIGVTQVGLLIDYGSLGHTEVMESLDVFATKILPRARKI